MGRFGKWIEQVRAQLSVLTVSQRLAIGLCAALIAGSLLWLVQWSADPELVPLVTHEFDFDEMDAAERSLKANGIDYEVLGGGRIYVRPTDRHNALRIVHGADALPEGSLFDMEAVVTDGNPFQSPEARHYAQTYAKGNELARIIATSPAVKRASVILNPVTKRRLGAVADVPTASVTVTMASGHTMTRETVEGFAKLVAGAVAGLKPHNVYITDGRTMRSYTVPKPGDAASFDMLSMVKRHEEHYRAKILDKLADIPGVQVAVTVELDTSKKVTQNVKHGLPQVKTESTNSIEQSRSMQATEPGVQPNLGQTLTAGSQGGSQLSEESKVENFEPKLTQTETIEQMPFGVKKISAAIGIPRSFVVGVLMAQHPNAAENLSDDDASYVVVRDAQVSRVKASVQRIAMASAEDIEVDVYPDMEWSAEGGSWSKSPGGIALTTQGIDRTGALKIVRDYGARVGLTALALLSLYVMVCTVRKSADTVGPRRSPGTEAETLPPVEEFSLSTGSAPVGQAEVSESMLTGHEVDPETLRFRELGQEVSKLVDNDPAGSADLIRRWINES